MSRVTPGAFLRVPLEGVLVAALVLAVPSRASGIVATIVGMFLGVLTVFKILDMGFLATLDRPFHPLTDWRYFESAVGLLDDSIGPSAAVMSLLAAVVAGFAVLISMPLSLHRLTRIVNRHRATSIGMVSVLGLTWITCAVFGVRTDDGTPIASASVLGLAYRESSQIRADIRDEQTFGSSLGADRFASTPGDDLLTGLRGSDVIIAFVESYGQVAVQGTPFSTRIDAELDAGSHRLLAAGFSSRSAFLISPTFGGISWLAHSTLQSGLWINSQQRYDELVASDRFTLSDAFKRAGWRTVGDVPSNKGRWAEGKSFYHYDKIYNARNVGYRGPKFSYASMPDQYVLSAFQHRELAQPHHAPIMAEIDLVSSHTPWARLPHMIAWSNVGDGSVFDKMAAQSQSDNIVWRDTDQVRAAYARSIEYSLRALISFVRTYHDNNLVLIMLGDHQPATVVSGAGVSHDVPITIIAHDPDVMDRISGWGWQDGLRPGRHAPVWRMDAFRDRFLSAFGPSSGASGG